MPFGEYYVSEGLLAQLLSREVIYFVYHSVLGTYIRWWEFTWHYYPQGSEGEESELFNLMG